MHASNWLFNDCKLTFDSFRELQVEENGRQFALAVRVHVVVVALKHDVVPLDVFQALFTNKRNESHAGD